jgi:hypothetical protein
VSLVKFIYREGYVVLYMSKQIVKVATFIMSAAVFIALHESGHYLAAASMGLGPSIVFGEQTSAAFAGMGIGVSYWPAGELQQLIVILAALIPPLLIGAFLHTRDNELLKLVGSVFLMQSVMAFVPLPGTDAATLLKLI